jgi:hypothetical protein
MRISASSSNAFKRCKRAYYYYKTEPFNKSVAFNFGLGFEYGLEKYLENKDITKSLELAIKRFNEDIADIAFKEELNKITTKLGYCDVYAMDLAKTNANEEICRHIELMNDMLPRLINELKDKNISFEAMQLETIQTLPNNNKVEVRLDGLVEYKGVKWIFELKSYKTFKSIDELRNDNQLRTYMAVNKMQNMGCVGVLFCQVKKELPQEPKILAKGGLSTDKSQKCSADSYMNKAIELYGDNIPDKVYECYNELLNKSGNIEILEVVFNDDILESHIGQLEVISEDMDILDKLRRDGNISEFYRRAYPNYGIGCSMCNYKEKCWRNER